MRKTLENTVDKYRRNREGIPKKDQETKYKAAFDSLIERMLQEAEQLLNMITVGGFQVLKSDGEPLIEAIKESFKINKIGSRIGRALFEHYSMDEFYKVAMEQRKRNEELYQVYVTHHVCLYASPECFEEDSETAPLIYNDATEEFYDTETKTWKKLDKPEGGAIIMRILKDREVIR